MGKNPWEDLDPDMKALASPRGAIRWKPLLTALGGVVLFTILLGYYVPLYRAHGALLEDHEKLESKVQALEQAAQARDRELAAMKARNAELADAQREHESKVQSAAQKLDKLKASVRSKLSKLKQSEIALGATDRSVVVALSHKLVFSPRKLDVSRSGREALCGVAEAASGVSLRAGSVAGSKRGLPGAVTRQYKTSLSLSAARAASVSETLHKSCKVDDKRLSAVGLGEQGTSAFKGGSPPSERIEIELLVP